MTTFNRWALLALGLAVVIGVGYAARVRPVDDPDLSATELLALVEQGRDAPYSGYAETLGTLQLPAADRFSDVGALFGERTRLRVWWQDDEHWRVDRLGTAGETDLVHTGRFTTEYDYEDARATTGADPDIRLPRTADLLPRALVDRLLADVDDQDVSRVAARRVAGRTAPGLRLRPGSAQSSIDHVDLWADAGTGLALRVDVYAVGSTEPDLTSELLEVDTGPPDPSALAFVPSETTEQRFEDVLDIADAANQYAPLRPPTEVAGLPMSPSARGAVGVYGAGLTQLIAIPLRSREADPLREQVRGTAEETAVGTGSLTGSAVTVGPLGVLVTGEDGDGAWLVAGTVTRATLEQAALDLLSGTVYLGEDDR